MIELLQPEDLKEAIQSSERYTKPFWQAFPELERLSRAQPGRVPKGKPRITDGTLAGKTREAPKQAIQQLPTGVVHIKKYPDLNQQVTAVLTDEILPYANASGTPYSKSKRGIKDTFRNGASIAYVYMDTTGDKYHANWRRIYAKDLLVEQGKVSEFDWNYVTMIGWFTKTDLQKILNTQKELQGKGKKRGDKYQSDWDPEVLQELIDGAEEPKDDDNKSEADKKVTSEDNGYIKLYTVFQRGVGATFYCYSLKLDKVARKWPNPDPRGVMPIHTLVPEEDDANPYGEPILAISAGKQNLLDFEMQNYQYNQAMGTSPAVKKWGAVKKDNIKIEPDRIIDMGAQNKTASDFETVDINNAAIANFPTNYGLVKSQIINELGTATDTSISAESGNPGFSKTDSGVNQMNTRNDIFNNDMRKSYEEWFGRICETALNIHFATSKGKKVIDLEPATRKKLKLQDSENLEVNYDQDYGPIKFTVDASTSQAADSQKKTASLVSILEITSQYSPLPPDKQMLIINQVVQNSGIDDPEKLQFTDEEITAAAEQYQSELQMQRQAALNPPQPPMAPAGDPNAQPPVQQGAPAQPQQFSDDEQQLVQGLQQRGVSNDDIATAVTMLRNGYDENQIVQALTGGGQQ